MDLGDIRSEWEKNFFILMDMPYQGFVSGDPEKDGYAVRLFAENDVNMFVAQSFAKNFGLYGHRIGVLSTPNQDVELVEKMNNQMNKTTVYRILDRLEQDGLIHSFLGRNGIKWYAKCNGCSNTEHIDEHPHFQCVDCGKVDCLDIHVNIPQIPNRHIEVSQVLIQGKCEDCLG